MVNSQWSKIRLFWTLERQSPQVGKPFRQFLLGETPKTGLPTLLRRYRYANTTALAPLDSLNERSVTMRVSPVSLRLRRSLVKLTSLYLPFRQQ
jgi:hypothetical protein